METIAPSSNLVFCCARSHLRLEIKFPDKLLVGLIFNHSQSLNRQFITLYNYIVKQRLGGLNDRYVAGIYLY